MHPGSGIADERSQPQSTERFVFKYLERYWPFMWMVIDESHFALQSIDWKIGVPEQHVINAKTSLNQRPNLRDGLCGDLFGGYSHP